MHERGRLSCQQILDALLWADTQHPDVYPFELSVMRIRDAGRGKEGPVDPTQHDEASDPRSDGIKAQGQKRPAISVLIPAHNASATIIRALDSVLAQAYSPLEIVVVDDGSTDTTAALVDNYRRLPIRLVRHQSNQGSSAALNTALEAATHDLVAFLDADDEWLPGKLDAQIAELAAEPHATLVATGYQWVESDGRVTAEVGTSPFRYDGRQFWRNLLLKSVISKPTVLTRRSLIAKLGGFNASLAVAEDQDMWIRLAAMGPVRYVHRPLMRTYSTAGSLMKRHKRYDLRYTIPMIRKNLALFEEELTMRERRQVLGRRFGIAAQNLLDQRDWWPALYATGRAIIYGDRPFRNILNLLTKSLRLNELARGRPR